MNAEVSILVSDEKERRVKAMKLLVGRVLIEEMQANPRSFEDRVWNVIKELLAEYQMALYVNWAHFEDGVMKVDIQVRPLPPPDPVEMAIKVETPGERKP